MKQTALIFAAVILMAGAGFGIGFAHGGQPGTDSVLAQSAAASGPDTDIPAYHAAPPTGAVPDTLDSKQFSDVRTQKIYAMAAKVKPVLYQQPCYCHCDKEVGHTSLLSCYTDRHASVCALCQKEAVLAYTESQKGKTAAQIRKEIIDGKWKDVDMSKYETPAAATQ